MVVLQIFLAKMIHVLRIKNHKTIQALLANRLLEVLNVGIRVGSAVWIADRHHVVLMKSLLKLSRELRVTVKLHKSNCATSIVLCY